MFILPTQPVKTVFVHVPDWDSTTSMRSEKDREADHQYVGGSQMRNNWVGYTGATWEFRNNGLEPNGVCVNRRYRIYYNIICKPNVH